MNFSPPTWVREAAEEALKNVAPNHYSHPKGRIRLREAIKSFYGPQLNRELDVETEILVTSGANEGICGMSQTRVIGVTDLYQGNTLSSRPSWSKATK